MVVVVVVVLDKCIFLTDAVEKRNVPVVCISAFGLSGVYCALFG